MSQTSAAPDGDQSFAKAQGLEVRSSVVEGKGPLLVDSFGDYTRLINDENIQYMD
jgi:hypothetical protein